jgi:hypothetical protein
MMQVVLEVQQDGTILLHGKPIGVDQEVAEALNDILATSPPADALVNIAIWALTELIRRKEAHGKNTP